MDLLKGVCTEIRTERGIAIALLSSFLASSVWALFETNKQPASTAAIPVEEAVPPWFVPTWV